MIYFIVSTGSLRTSGADAELRDSSARPERPQVGGAKRTPANDGEKPAGIRPTL
jgi:hypothetical protein